MKRTEISFNINTVPISIRPFMQHARIYDSSCSENARTLLVEGAEKAYLKISKRGSLEREYAMTRFLNSCHAIAPKVIAYESDADQDYLFTEAVAGEDGTAEEHIGNPGKLAGVFGEYLRMLHSLPIEGCPYPHRTAEMLNEQTSISLSSQMIEQIKYEAADNAIIHGDYCLPNIIMDRFVLKGFIDLGYGGVGDRHYDIYWGIWTLNYNLKSDKYKDIFLDAYGRQDVDKERLNLFASWIEMAD
ncbi:aminoglycoside 3'-phosphotransferase [Paenibacillus sp. UNC451MF]|uniref:aminoglycoside 3'-phosphotransferase n=1 Tax=Paenibacillus sp. UNC451MF TaxID=1449063 RepID=UPI00048F8B61|nr:aminoglycoside 3'-phosphotransferase [Paenibacillus sp. UNC451MF]